MDWAIGKFTTISQIVEPFGQAVYLDVKQYDNEQSSTEAFLRSTPSFSLDRSDESDRT